MSTPSDESDRVLTDKVVAVPEARQLDVLAGLLERRGASVLRCPLVGILDSPDEPAVLAWIERLIATPTDLAVFYTGEGVQRLVGFARRAGREAPFVAALARTPKLTRGPKPKRALKALELEPEYMATEPTTAGMIEAAKAIAAPLRRVALQLYNQDQDRQLVDYFEQRGAAVDAVAPYVYASQADDERVAALIGELAARPRRCHRVHEQGAGAATARARAEAAARSGAALRPRANEGRGHRARRRGGARERANPRRHDARQKAIR